MTATLTTLIAFNVFDGDNPTGGLIADANGDLFGITVEGGADNFGTVFEIARTSTGYASAPTTLVSFDGSDGELPQASLIADANGDLFGTTLGGAAADNEGTVFEIAKTSTGYASAPTTLVSFNGSDGEYPYASLIADAQGDLFGETSGGSVSDGTVFEIGKTATGYASSPSTLVSFDGAVDGEHPEGSLIADANGDLFGTTSGGMFSGASIPLANGTVFEIARTATGYASSPTTLVSFDGADGEAPVAGLIADANGDLFGTTKEGGADSDGTVFEIAKTSTGYASAPTTLVSFDGADGAAPFGSLIADANGDLFGTTYGGGADGFGTVFELAKTSTGYASAPTTVASFDGSDGLAPIGGLFADANGDLLGATPGIPNFADGWYTNIDSTVFEVTGSGFVPPAPVQSASDILFQSTSGQAAIWEMSGTNLVGGGAVSPNPGSSWETIGTGDFFGAGPTDILWQSASGQVAIWEMSGANLVGGGTVSQNPGPSWHAVGTGDFNDDGRSDILFQSASGQAAVWDMNGSTLVGGGVVSQNPGPSWKAVGTGDFNDDGHSDILWQNTSSGQVAIWEMNGDKLIGGGAVSPNPGPSWKLIGSGDFNHDGHSDLLWQNANGQVAIWEMNGTSIIGGGVLSVDPGPSWHAIGTGSEGTSSDILFQSTSGQTAIWDMNGTTIASGGLVGPNPGPSWKAVGLGL